MAQVGGDDPKAKLEKIKKQLSAGTGSVLLHGPLLKRSETLRKWNQRWFTLDPSTGKMEYRFQRGDPSPRGLIHFDADSTITVSPLNIHGDRKYDGCCFYVGTAQKKESFLCAETPAAARAWVASLRAAALVLKAHKDAVNSLSGNGNAKLGTVAASVAAANATAQEAMKDIQASFRPSVVAVSQSSTPASNVSIDNSTILKETLRVKDDELNQLQRDLRARDFTIKELAERLSEMADAVESGAKAIHLVDKDRQVALSEVEHMKKELLRAAEQIKAAEERVVAANKTRDLALQEAHRWRVELGKAREQCVIWEGAVQRGHEHARQLKKAHEQELASLAQAQELRSTGPQVDAKIQDESPSTPKGSQVDAKVQGESPSTPKGSIIPALSEPHAAASPKTPEAEGSVPPPLEPTKATSQAESAEAEGSVPPPLEPTKATPQADSAEANLSLELSKATPQAESSEANLSGESTKATPQAESTNAVLSLEATPQAENGEHAPEPAVSESTSPHELPPIEQFHEVAESPPEEEAPVIPFAPVIPEAPIQADEVAPPHTGEIPMNESGS